MHGRDDDKQPPWLLIKERDGLVSCPGNT